MPTIAAPRALLRFRLAGAALAGVMFCVALLGALPGNAETAVPGDPKPRAAFTVGGLEMVLVLARDRLYAFVDGVDDNAPTAVDGLAVETGKRRWDLVGVGPGLYLVTPFVLPAGHQALTVDIATAAGVTQVETALDIGKPMAAAGTSAGWLVWLWWIVTGTAVVALAVVLTGRRLGADLLKSLSGAG